MIPDEELEVLRDIRRHLPFKDMPEQVPAGTLFFVPGTKDPKASPAEWNASKSFTTLGGSWSTAIDMTSDPGPLSGSYMAAITYDLKFSTDD